MSQSLLAYMVITDNPQISVTLKQKGLYLVHVY